MKRDIKKRLEKALVVLKEPGGSTIRSIIKVINKESPILSLRKVLEALQEGMNEGFVCMYNGRFKLKQQVNAIKNFREKILCESRRNSYEEKDSETTFNFSNSYFYDDDKSEFSSNAEKLTNVEEEDLDISRTQTRYPNISRNKKANHFYGAQRVFCIAPKKQSSRHESKLAKKCSKSKRKIKIQNKKLSKQNKQSVNVECNSIFDVTGDCRESNMSNRQAAEKLDIKKQRGPRCTSMKKDIRMPSKVHIPFMLPSVPQRSNTFNELLRRSPEPVNGPLFDSYNEFSCKPDKLEFFKPYY